jgi:hypothetical protein
LHDLLSSEAGIRRKALDDVGIPSGDPLDQAELRYVWMCEQRAAILLVPDGHDVYAAVAVPSEGAWKRIAVLLCSCFNDSQRILDDFVQVENRLDGGREMVVHASTGGNHDYQQTEGAFHDLRRGSERSDIFRPHRFRMFAQRRLHL